jgi:hypothetical protein
MYDADIDMGRLKMKRPRECRGAESARQFILTRILDDHEALDLALGQHRPRALQQQCGTFLHEERRNADHDPAVPAGLSQSFADPRLEGTELMRDHRPADARLAWDLPSSRGRPRLAHSIANGLTVSTPAGKRGRLCLFPFPA